MENYDVIVVGAGLAGLQTARLLGQRGFRVLLVDRKPSLDQSIHTTGIFVRRTLEAFALPEDCLGPPVRHVTHYSPARRSMELISPQDEFRVGRMGLLYQRFLNNAKRAGVEPDVDVHRVNLWEATWSQTEVRFNNGIKENQVCSSHSNFNQPSTHPFRGAHP